MLHPKFILENGNLIIARGNYHRDIALNVEDVQGGGWWRKKDNTFILHGTSGEFGRADLGDLKKAIKEGKVYTNRSMLNSIADRYDFKFEEGCTLFDLK